jgi:hypothetical protein
MVMDPGVGRFMEEDPQGFEAGDTNLSRYVGNDPTDATDPSGNFLVTAGKEAAEKVQGKFAKLGLNLAVMALPPVDKDNVTSEGKNQPAKLYIVLPPPKNEIGLLGDDKWQTIRDDAELHDLWHAIDGVYAQGKNTRTLITDAGSLKGQDVSPFFLSWNQKLAIFVERAARDPEAPQDITNYYQRGDIRFLIWERDIIAKLSAKDAKGNLAPLLSLAPLPALEIDAAAAMKNVLSAKAMRGLAGGWGYSRMIEGIENDKKVKVIASELIKARKEALAAPQPQPQPVPDLGLACSPEPGPGAMRVSDP